MDRGINSQNCKTVTLYNPATLAVKFNLLMNFNNMHVKSMYLNTVLNI